MDREPARYRTVIVKDPSLRQFEGGFTAVPNRVLTNTELILAARMVHAMLLKYAWQDDFCWPAQQRLGRDLGLKDRMVRYYLEELRKARLIDWKRQGLNRPNLYYILGLPAAGSHAPEHADSGPDRQHLANPEWQSPAGQERQYTADKEYSENKTQNNVNVLLNTAEHPQTEVTADRADAVTTAMLDALRDRHSIGFYRRVAHAVPEHLIFQALSETKDQAARGRIRT